MKVMYRFIAMNKNLYFLFRSRIYEGELNILQRRIERLARIQFRVRRLPPEYVQSATKHRGRMTHDTHTHTQTAPTCNEQKPGLTKI